MAKTADRYVPAMGADSLLHFYDPLQRFVLREHRYKGRLVEYAEIGDGRRVLDVGCGTGTLVVMMATAHPGAEIVGLDGDPKALAVAREKAERAGVTVALDEGMSFELPYPDASFDRATSSLMLHHLTRENKDRTLREIVRVLRPGGKLVVCDFGKPVSAWSGLLARALHHVEDIEDNLAGRIPDFMGAAGLENVSELGHHTTVGGSFSYYRGEKCT